MKKTLSALTISALLASCASYNATTLSYPSIESVDSEGSHSEKSVLAIAKRFNKQECRRYLDRDVIAQGYIPVQLFIQNNSSHTYHFSTKRISLSCATPEEVAEKVHTSTVARVVGYGVGALFLWPLAIPAVVDGIRSSEANTSLDNDFIAKSAKDCLISPHSYFNQLIFVPVRDYDARFSITLIDQDSREPKTLSLIAS